MAVSSLGLLDDLELFVHVILKFTELSEGFHVLEPFFRVLLHAFKVITEELSVIVDTDKRNDGSYQVLFHHVPLEDGKCQEKTVFFGFGGLANDHERIDKRLFRWLSAVGAF